MNTIKNFDYIIEEQENKDYIITRNIYNFDNKPKRTTLKFARTLSNALIKYLNGEYETTEILDAEDHEKHNLIKTIRYSKIINLLNECIEYLEPDPIDGCYYDDIIYKKIMKLKNELYEEIKLSLEVINLCGDYVE